MNGSVRTVKALGDPAAARALACKQVALEDIQALGKEALLRLQKQCGNGDVWGEWIVPLEWLPPSLRANYYSRITLERDAASFDKIWTELLRFALLLRLAPTKDFGHRAQSTISQLLFKAVRIAPKLNRAASRKEAFWGAFSVVEYKEQLSEDGAGKLLSVLWFFESCGYLSGLPEPNRKDDSAEEPNRYGEEARKRPATKKVVWQPLPDEYVGKCGKRALWIARVLGPQLLDCLERYLASDVRTSKGEVLPYFGPVKSYPNGRKIRIKAYENILLNKQWKNGDGSPLDEFPYIFLDGKKRVAAPPSSVSEFHFLLSLLQAANMWLALLMTGPRSSTLLSYEEDCVVKGPDGYRVNARIFKNADEVGGRKRDFPVPDALAVALIGQRRLASLLKQGTGQDNPNLFVTITGKVVPGAPLWHVGNYMRLIQRAFGLDHLLKGEKIVAHPHRFRKTLARIVALSISNSQMILMDCFGHDDPVMTLGYMTSDESLMADVQEMQKEIVILMAVDAIDEAEDLGGAVGEKVRTAKSEYLRVNNKSKLSPQDAYELAASLTMGGQDWAVVMPGVICTLPVGFTGPCSAKGGGRDPGNCQSHCDHQLLTLRNKQECDDTVKWVLEQLARAVEEQSLDIEMWRGQLHNWLYRWPDVYEKYADDPLVVGYGNPNLLQIGKQI